MRKLAPALLLLLITASLAVAQEEREPEALSGRLTPGQVTELKVELKAYNGELRVESILAPGTAVKAGEQVAKLTAPDYELQLERARTNLKLAEWALRPIAEGRAHTERGFTQRHEAARRSAERAEQELKHFVDVDRARSIRNSELNLKSFEFNIADQKQELEQLKRLYKGNDLAEESQEIVLQRAYRRLEVSEERFKISQDEHQRYIDVHMKRRQEDLTAGRDAAALELERLNAEAERGASEYEARLIKATQAVADAAKHLTELEADAGRMSIKAPHDGHVAIGAWGGNDGVSAGIKAGDATSRGAVVASVVDTSKLKLSVNVKVNARAKFTPGTPVKINDAENGLASTGTVTGVGFVVSRSGMVAAHIEVDNSGGTLLPGLKVSVALTE